MMEQNAMTQQDQLDQAFYYIKELKERVDRLRELEETRSRVMIGFRPSHVEEINLEVILVRGSRTRFIHVSRGYQRPRGRRCGGHQ
ncbi:hypothetical protein B296_00046820 [Ensete ventricosum]|uniref:Uncharacterized protein n=1 Tax=Ensete ventricosum TaxID=4639 RepID=A0A426WXJ6_ENSVE|nr:hypothetical protein B296_00046820 [Ensete ventricosum]